ncbi:MAG: hypothetical protein QOE72_3549 [Chloroflexota bacterium]|nr:hypothetical protein [Chloroflexota bacterium]
MNHDHAIVTLTLHVGCEIAHKLEWPVPAVLQVEPRPDGGFRVATERWSITPPVDTRTYLDIYGNLCRRLVLPPGESVIEYHALVEASEAVDDEGTDALQLPVDQLPDEVLLYTLPSRLCESDTLSTTAWKMFGAVDPGWARAQAICDWVHDNLDFTMGASNPETTACDVYLRRAGVCRDFAQLAITLCRGINIPARYAFGYLPDIGVDPPDEPMDFCAWLEVFLGDRWWTFDPRNNQRRCGRVLIGLGRDAIDTPMITSYGAAPLTRMTVWAEPAEEAP